MLYTHHLRGPTQLEEGFTFWEEGFNFLPAFFHTLEIPHSLPKNQVHVTGSQRFWPLDVRLNTIFTPLQSSRTRQMGEGLMPGETPSGCSQVAWGLGPVLGDA